MKDIMYMLIRASITASLSDREAFITKVSKIIEQYSRQDPQVANHLSHQIAGAMEQLDESLLFHQLLKPQHNEELNKTLNQLTRAIEQLNTLLEKKETSMSHSKNKEQ